MYDVTSNTTDVCVCVFVGGFTQLIWWRHFLARLAGVRLPKLSRPSPKGVWRSQKGKNHWDSPRLFSIPRQFYKRLFSLFSSLQVGKWRGSCFHQWATSISTMRLWCRHWIGRFGWFHFFSPPHTERTCFFLLYGGAKDRQNSRDRNGNSITHTHKTPNEMKSQDDRSQAFLIFFHVNNTSQWKEDYG